jgi:hypothetical protein
VEGLGRTAPSASPSICAGNRARCQFNNSRNLQGRFSRLVSFVRSRHPLQVTPPPSRYQSHQSHASLQHRGCFPLHIYLSPALTSETVSPPMERILESRVWKFFRSGAQGSFKGKDELYGTPTLSPRSRSSLPSSDSASTSSLGSISSSTSFWRSSPRQSKWSFKRYVPASIRFNVSKRQLTVLTCLFLTGFVWFAPPPSTWHHHKTRYVLEQQPSSPYQVLRPAIGNPKKHASDPEEWLKQNSGNKYAVGPGTGKLSAYGRFSTKPRAALISLVRNSELEGILQSMRQLEYRWNRKYQYPWIFFNDEPFNDEFKVGDLSHMEST